MKRMRFITLLLAVLLCINLIGCSSESEQKDPGPGSEQKEPSSDPTEVKDETVVIGSLAAGSSGYNQTSALAEGLAQGGYKVRVIPTGNGINRVTQLMDGAINYFVGYDEVYLSLEAMAEYAANKVGPVQLRTVLGNTMGISMVTTGDSGVETPADLRGKRVGYVPGDASVGYKTTSLLAFGGLTWDDVIPVAYPAWVESVKGIVAGTCDSAQQALPPSSTIYELASTPKGVAYPTFAHDDEEAWDRLHEWAPWIFKHKINAQDLVGLEGDEDLEFVGFISPSLVTLASTSEEEVYNLVKTLDEQYDVYKDSLPEMKGWAVEQAGVPPLSAPVHQGVVKYLTEKGIWTDEHEAWNKEVTERSKKLQEVWDKALAEAKEKNISDSDFEEFWMNIKKEEIGGFTKMLPEFMRMK